MHLYIFFLSARICINKKQRERKRVIPFKLRFSHAFSSLHAFSHAFSSRMKLICSRPASANFCPAMVGVCPTICSWTDSANLLNAWLSFYLVACWHVSAGWLAGGETFSNALDCISVCVRVSVLGWDLEHACVCTAAQLHICASAMSEDRRSREAKTRTSIDLTFSHK